MAESLGSQASDAANKAASEVDSAAQAAEVVAGQANDAVEGAADAAKSTVSGANQAAGDATSAATGAVKQTTAGASTAAKTAATGAAAAASGTAAKATPAGAKPAGAAPVAGTKPAVATSGAAKPVGAAGTSAGVKPAGAAAKPAAKPAAAKEEAPVAAPPKGITRREFLNYVWGASMALFLVQFGGITFFFAMPRFRAGEFGGKIPVRVADFPQTNAPPVANNPGKFWLVQTDAGINTLYKICTHLGCIYPWSDAAGIFACPCHGSQFQLNGDWIAGPAARSLDKFAFEVLDASGAVLATVTDGNAIPMPAGADTVVVNTGVKILGQSHF